MNDVAKAFCEELVRLFPDVTSLLREHVADNDEVLPHVFMGDVTRYVLSEGVSRKQLVSHLDKSLREGPNDIQDLVAVSFVENLTNKEELKRALEGVEGGAIRAEWRRQHGM